MGKESKPDKTVDEAPKTVDEAPEDEYQEAMDREKQEDPDAERKEAYEEDANAEKDVAANETASNPFTADRNELEQSTWRMLKQMKFIRLNAEKMAQELAVVEAEYSLIPQSSTPGQSQ